MFLLNCCTCRYVPPSISLNNSSIFFKLVLIVAPNLVGEIVLIVFHRLSAWMLGEWCWSTSNDEQFARVVLECAARRFQYNCLLLKWNNYPCYPHLILSKFKTKIIWTCLPLLKQTLGNYTTINLRGEGWVVLNGKHHLSGYSHMICRYSFLYLHTETRSLVCSICMIW